VHGKVSPETILLTHMDRDRPLVKLTGFSPESFLHRTDADERADVYGLAAVLHQLLTGVPAGTGGTPPEGMRDVLARALDPSPAHRFQTVADFAAALPRPGELVIQQPPQPTSARQHKLARNLWPEEQVVVAVLVAVVVAIGLLWYTYTPGPSAPSRPRLEETGSAAGYQPAISSSAASSPPARLPAKTPSRAPARLPAKAPPAAPAPLSSAAADSLLVDVRSLDPTIQTDMRYATRNNFTGAPLPGYEAPLALLRREGAAALSRVQARLRSQGLGLRVLDAYRPVRASRAMVDWAERTGNRPLIEKGYIPERTRHNLGASVDVTLVDLATGTEVIGTNDFDNFAGTTDTSDATAPALRYRKILVQAMESEGFSQFGRSWWHFNYPVEGAIPLDRVIR
jgi:D-alanyl-D-alanine dipeptidase